MTDSPALPRLAMTIGDPAGVGPEIIARAWLDPRTHQACRPLVVGHPEIMRAAIQLIGASVDVVEVPADAVSRDDQDTPTPTPATMTVLRAVSDDAVAAPRCTVDGRSGQAAYDALLTAGRMALAGTVDAIVTAPLHKGALWAAGHHYPGHTELLAELCGVDDFAMMLYLAHDQQIRSPAGLAIVHVTLHMSIARALATLDTDGIVAKTQLVDRFLRDIGCDEPRIGVCALNPHGGEDGLFGDEELRVIAPAVARGQVLGVDAKGPYPADTLIARARDGQFDGVVAMYHDQGHIAIKLLAMHRAVNITLGLPIVRTSVAHGTAFDIAWQGRAESRGMIAAIETASRLAISRGKARR